MTFLTPVGLSAAGPLSLIILWNIVPKQQKYVYNFDLFKENFLKTHYLNSPGVISSKLDLHSGCLSNDFGVMITKGLRNGKAI